MTMKKLMPGDEGTQSPDLKAANLAHLRELFPEAFSEGKLDFMLLQQLLPGEAVDEREEKYGLNWHGKRQARQIALTPSMGTLRPCPEESVDWNTTNNLMIEGDNLEVLKLLQKSYAGKVKLIYIDPPYNTGSDFVYPDNYQDNVRNYLELTGQVEGGKKISSNTESNGRFHTDWLNMIYPRLKLARNLLRRDGVIFISIDDVESDNLRIICNDVLGEENFVARLVWEKGRKNDAKLFSIGHDYMLVYAASKAFLTEQGVRWREAKPGAGEIQAEYTRLRSIHGENHAQVQSELRDWYTRLPSGHPSKRLTRYSNVDERGVWRDDNMSWPGGGGPTYDVIHPMTRQPCSVPEGGWRYSTAEKMQEMISAGRVQFRDDHTEPPIRKTYLVRINEEAEEDESGGNESDDVSIQVAGTYFYRSALQASRLMLSMFRSKVFDNPKDHEVLARWISYVSLPSKDDIILDFFAGSGTTGHAVMAQNSADGGTRRFILVQLPEPLDPDNKDQKVAAGFCKTLKRPLNIAELTKERLRRASGRIREESPMFSGDLGFRVFKLDTTNIKEWEPKRDEIPQTLSEAIENLKGDRSEDDILFELLLKIGLDLCVPIETRTIAGKKVYSIGGGVLFACLAKQITISEVEKLGQGIVDWYKALAPAGDSACRFRDSAFPDDIAKTNLVAILSQNGIKTVRSL